MGEEAPPQDQGPSPQHSRVALPGTQPTPRAHGRAWASAATAHGTYFSRRLCSSFLMSASSGSESLSLLM